MQAKVDHIQQRIEEQKAALVDLRQKRKDQFQSLLMAHAHQSHDG